MTTFNTIRLKGDFRHEEDTGFGTIKPGMLVALYNNAGARTVRPHPTAGGFAERSFAVEDALQGKTVDDAYTTGTVVSYAMVWSGAVVNALLKAGASYALGDQLMSAGDGTLKRVADAESDETASDPVAVVNEAIDLSDSAAVDTLSPVRVL